MTNDRQRLRSVPPLKASPADIAKARAELDDRLHTYCCMATGYNLERALVIYRRVGRTLDGQLNPMGGDAA